MRMQKLTEQKVLLKLSVLKLKKLYQKRLKNEKLKLLLHAEAEKHKIDAYAQAAAILAIKEAEAQGILNTLKAKADGYKMLVEACGSNAQDAATMLMIEKIEEIVKLQAEAIKNIKIDKITVWDSGTGDSSSTANFLSNIVKSVPPLHEVAAMSGVKLPEYLGTIEKDKQG